MVVIWAVLCVRLRCPVMLVVGDSAPYEEAAVSFTANSMACFVKWNQRLIFIFYFVCDNQVECNSKLDPTTTSFLKVRRPVCLLSLSPYVLFCVTHVVCPFTDGWCWWSPSADPGNKNRSHNPWIMWLLGWKSLWLGTRGFVLVLKCNMFLFFPAAC